MALSKVLDAQNPSPTCIMCSGVTDWTVLASMHASPSKRFGSKWKCRDSSRNRWRALLPSHLGISVNYMNFGRANNAGFFHRILDFIASQGCAGFGRVTGFSPDDDFLRVVRIAIYANTLDVRLVP